MTDPFTSLRRTAELAEPAPRFREALLSDVRCRLVGDDNPVLSEPATPTTTLPITLEVTHMKPNSDSRGRALLMAAAAVLLIAGAIAIVLTRRDTADGTPSANTDPPASAPLTTVPPTTVPQTTVAPTTVPPTTTMPLPTDAEIAAAVLLPAQEYAPDWVIQPATAPAPDDLLRADVASSIDACSPYIADVFEADDAAAVRSRQFYHGPPTEALFGENVLVLATEDVATAMFDAIDDPGFVACGAAYNDKFSLGFPPIDVLGSLAVELPFDPVGDQLLFSRYDGTWVHPLTGETHGPETNLGAALRVGRVVVFIGTLNMGDVDAADNVEVVSEAQFRQTLVHIVERATAALAG